MAPFLFSCRRVFSKSLFRVTVLSFLALLNGACSKSEYQNLSEKPSLSVIPYSSQVNESIVQTHLTIPLPRLREKLEADIPELLYDDPGKIKEKCIRIFGKSLCETYQVGGWVNRTGPVQLTALNNGFLRIAIPLKYKLKVRGKGKIVKELLRNIDFKEASFTAIADLQPRINRHWKLQLAAESYIQWHQSPRVKILGIELDIQNKVEKPIQKALNKALLKQQKKIAADNRFKERVTEFWSTLHQSKKLKGPFPLWLKATPQALSLSTLQVDNAAIHIGLSLRTMLTTSNNSDDFLQPSPLPPLVNQTIGKSAIHINLPLALAYEDLANSLQDRLKKKPLEYKQGKISLTVKAIEIYPSNDRLVLAAKVKINGLANLLASDGEIYISGKPVIDNKNKILRLADVAFSRKLDSPFWSTATSLLHDQLLDGLKSALVHDFSESYEALHGSINKQLQGQHGKKIKLNGELYGLEIQGLHPDLDELRLILKARGAVNLELINL